MNQLSKNKGTALVITLFVIAALTTLAVSFSNETGIELNLTAYSRDNRMAHQMACSGANLAIALIDQDENKDVDSLDDPWAQFSEETIPWKHEEDSELNGRVQDENSKLNLNKLLSEDGEISGENAGRLIRVFSALGLEESQADPILDWLDEDDTELIEGAEDLYYSSLDVPYHCANGPLLTIAQIRLVKGVADIIEKLDKEGKNLFDYFTIHGDGKININTAPPEVLQSLHEQITAEIAQAIVDERQNEIFSKISDITRVNGIDQGEGGLYEKIQDRITVKGDSFSIHMEGVYRTSSSSVTAIIEREEEGVKIVYWRTQ